MEGHEKQEKQKIKDVRRGVCVCVQGGKNGGRERKLW